jgi:carbonic anhydrase
MPRFGIAIVLTLAAVAAFGAEKTCPPTFSYCGYSGPSQWENLPIAGNECGGQAQSPVDIAGWTAGPGPAISVHYKDGPASIANQGYDIEVKPAESSGFISAGGDKYLFRRFHFHVPSEHAVDGQKSPAELHLVHESESGDKTAVIAVLLAVGDSNPALAEVFRRLPMKACSCDSAHIELQSLLPATIASYYTYDGSLTTPPCSEGVKFYIPKGTGITISQAELDKLASLGDNARPLQEINNRQIRLIEPTQ